MTDLKPSCTPRISKKRDLKFNPIPLNKCMDLLLIKIHHESKVVFDQYFETLSSLRRSEMFSQNQSRKNILSAVPTRGGGEETQC